jgi:hypothetical protein
LPPSSGPASRTGVVHRSVTPTEPRRRRGYLPSTVSGVARCRRKAVRPRGGPFRRGRWVGVPWPSFLAQGRDAARHRPLPPSFCALAQHNAAQSVAVSLHRARVHPVAVNGYVVTYAETGQPVSRRRNGPPGCRGSAPGMPRIGERGGRLASVQVSAGSPRRSPDRRPAR